LTAEYNHSAVLFYQQLEINVTTDLSLIEKRETLKRRLASGEYKTLVDLCLGWFEQLVRKVTRQAKPLPLWVISTALVLIMSVAGFSIIYFTDNLFVVTPSLNQVSLLINFLIIALFGGQAIISSIAINQLIRSHFSLLHDMVLDAIESEKSMDDIKNWLEATCNKKYHLLVAIIGGVSAGLYARSLLNASLFLFIGNGAAFIIIIFSIFSTVFLQLLFMILILSGRLSKYHLKLFAPDPSNSELIFQLSNKLNLVVYFVGVYAAVMTFIFVESKFFTSAGIFLVLILWLPLIALFILNQTSLTSIIRRAKWKTLNEIQAQVEELRVTGSLKNKDTIEAINRLMDFHDRIKATRNSAVDLRTVLNFINSLLLPLLAFLLGNLDKVLALFSKAP
jgi:hypothetical protein